MAKKHDIVILSDDKFGCEPGIYIDGINVGSSEGMLINDLQALQPYIKRGFTIRTGGGEPISVMNWPDELDDVEGLSIYVSATPNPA